MKRLALVLSILAVAILLATPADASVRSRGYVYCDNGNGVVDEGDLPLEGVRVVNVDRNANVYDDLTNEDGYFYVSGFPADPTPVYTETLDPATLPGDATIVIPASGSFVWPASDYSVWHIWLVDSEVCHSGVCGDGVVDDGEDCDDGNTDPGDGCDENCNEEVCGNGVVDDGEDCDDGNTDPGDGCDENCNEEQGECDLEVEKTCCIVPPAPPSSGGNDCNGKVTSLKLEYTGKACDATTNQQEGKVTCAGDPNLFQPVDVRVTDKDGIYVFANVSGVFLGDVVSAAASSGGLSELKADTLVTIDDGLQVVKFHTSCSKPLAVGDEFGAVRLVELTTTNGGTVTLPSSGGVNGESQCVAAGPVAPPHCKGKVIEAVFEYTGGNCSDTTNTQEGKATCSGDLNGLQPVSIVVTKDASAVSVTPSSGIHVGDAVSFLATGSELKSELKFNLGPQALAIHTSCSKPLNVGDVFGGMRLIELTTTQGGTVGEPEPSEPSSECFLPPAAPFVCDNKIGAISLRYDGGDCSQSNNPQEGKAHCTTFDTGAEPVRIRVFKDGGTVYLDTVAASVGLGDVVLATAANAGATSFGSQTYVQITDMFGNPVQDVDFHTSCSKPINVGDRFGSLEIVGLTDQSGVSSMPGATVEYSYTIHNPGSSDATDVSVVDDKLGAITDEPIDEIEAGGTVVLRKTAFISEETVNTVTVDYTQDGGECEASDSATVYVDETP